MSTQHPFPIVGIGASAGGLKAIEEIMQNLPEDTGMAFIIIQHLSRRFKSLMKEILIKDTRMSIIPVEDGMEVQPNCVYLMPAGINMVMRNRRLFLEDQKETDTPHFVIDTFLHSLGRDAREQSIGVILSGTGSDGSRGIYSIKEMGGVVIVQEPDSGEFDGMPLSSINTRIVDHILPPAEIAEKLVFLSRNPEPESLPEPEIAVPVDEDEENPVEDSETLALVLDLIQRNHEVDFSFYKIGTISRRIQKHMSVHGLDDMRAYHTFLLKSPGNINELWHELLIGVTEFFRDPAAYEALTQTVFPQLVNEERNGKEIRIWSCGCSTGEEVYSLLIALMEYGERTGYLPRFVMLATDVDERALSHAGRGRYSPSRLNNLPEVLLDKYFDYNGESYEVRKKLRDQVIFARNDVTSDPPFINLDLVVCRNLLIYMLPPVQRRIMLNFHFGLKPGGFMWLGSSESIVDFKTNFQVLNEKWKIFQAIGETPRMKRLYHLQSQPRKPKTYHPLQAQFREPEPETETQLRKPQFQYIRLLLQKFSPPCILFSKGFEVLYLTGGAGKYLAFPDTAFDMNILSMVSDSMVVVLRDAMRRFANTAERGPFLYQAQSVAPSGNPEYRDVVIEDLGVHMGRQVYMVQFVQNSHPQNGNLPATLVHPMPVDSDTYDLIRSLQEELNIARHEVQAGLEELETNNEELQAANEELVAANEELQSTNEELQSVNEELYTVNSELQVRNREISESKTLLDNLVSNMGSGVLFLDRGLNIRVFTPEFTQFVWLEETDIGMPIARFSMKWDFTDFVPNLRKILLDKQSTIEREVVLRGENESHVRHFLARLRPFLREGQVDGVIVFLIEITDRKKTEMALQAVEQNQRLILNSIPEYVSVVDVEGNLLYLNQPTQDLSEEDVQGQNLFSHVHPEDESLIRKAFKEALETGKPVEYRNRTFLPGGAERTFASRVIRFRKEEHLSYDLMILSYDVSESYAEEKKVQTQVDFFNRYMDANSSYIWIKDKDFRYIYTNAAARKELLMSDQNYAGHNDFSIFPQAIADQLRNLDEQVLSKGKMIESIQHHPQKPGSDEMVLMILFPIREGGQITHIGGMGLNITSLVKEYENIRIGQESMEEKVIERTTALIQANDDLRSFTRSIAHDLRSPIRAIFSYSQLLMDKPAPPVEQALEYAEKIHRQAQWTGQLIDSLMSFAKLGSVAVRKEWLDMQSIARRVYDDLSLQTEGRQIKFQIRNCPRIWGDIELTRQILTNLFSNAVKYTSRKEIAEIEFGGYHDEHKFEIVYFVKDNGIGFDQKFASKIFKMFERLHIESEYEGSGIGLAIVRRAIELQNGSVWVTSQIGQGTTFYFSFPIKT